MLILVLLGAGHVWIRSACVCRLLSRRARAGRPRVQRPALQQPGRASGASPASPPTCPAEPLPVCDRGGVGGGR